MNTLYCWILFGGLCVLWVMSSCCLHRSRLELVQQSNRIFWENCLSQSWVYHNLNSFPLEQAWLLFCTTTETTLHLRGILSDSERRRTNGIDLGKLMYYISLARPVRLLSYLNVIRGIIWQIRQCNVHCIRKLCPIYKSRIKDDVVISHLESANARYIHHRH